MAFEESVEELPDEAAAPSTASSIRIRVVLALLALYLVWSSTYLGIRVAVETIPPLYMGGVRFLIAGGLLYAILRARGIPAPTRQQWLGSAAVGLLLLMVGNGGVAIAEQKVASSIAAMMIATVPLWAAVFGGLWGRWQTRLEGVGLALGFAGIVILNFEGNLRANPTGAIILVLAAVGWAFGSIWSGRLPLPSGMMASALEMLAGGSGMMIGGLVSGERIVTVPTLRSLVALLYLIIFGSLVAFSAYVYLLRTVRPALATSYAYVNPAVAVLLGVVLGGEHISGRGILALFVIVSGVAMVLLGRESGLAAKGSA